MKVLFIGGTGTISSAISRKAAARGDELYLLNRGNRSVEVPEGARLVRCDIGDEAAAARALEAVHVHQLGFGVPQAGEGLPGE